MMIYNNKMKMMRSSIKYRVNNIKSNNKTIKIWLNEIITITAIITTITTILTSDNLFNTKISQWLIDSLICYNWYIKVVISFMLLLCYLFWLNSIIALSYFIILSFYCCIFNFVIDTIHTYIFIHSFINDYVVVTYMYQFVS